MRIRLTASAVAVTLAGLLAAGCGDDGGGSGDLVAFCEAAVDHERFETMFDDLDPADVDGARAAFVEAREAQAQLRAVAPEAARGDIDVVIAFVDDLIEGLELAASTDEQSRPSVYQSLRPRFDEVEAAGDRLDLYVDTNC